MYVYTVYSKYTFTNYNYNHLTGKTTHKEKTQKDSITIVSLKSKLSLSCKTNN